MIAKSIFLSSKAGKLELELKPQMKHYSCHLRLFISDRKHKMLSSSRENEFGTK